MESPAIYLPRHLEDVRKIKIVSERPLAKYKGVEFSYFENDETLTINFAGSDSFRDISRSLLCWIVKGFVYGYSSAARGCQQIAFKTFPEIAWQKPKIRLVGHSMGGAIAEKCAFDLAQQKWKIAEVVTFGSPCYSNGKWKTNYPVYRYICGHDIIPFWPLWGKHSSSAIHIPSPNFKTFSLFQPFKDHYLESYKKSLEEEVGRFRI